MTYVYASGQGLAVPKFNTRILCKGNNENKTINLKIKCLLTRVSSLSFFYSVFATHILFYDTYYTLDTAAILHTATTTTSSGSAGIQNWNNNDNNIIHLGRHR